MERIKRKILVVEDEKDIAQMYATKFSQEGYEVRVVNDGKEALDLLQKEDFDIVVMDILIPYLRGTEVLQELHKTKPELVRKTVVLSNYDDPDSREEVLRLGAKGYFLKTDYTPSELIEKIKDLFKD